MQRTREFDSWVKSHGGVFTRRNALDAGMTLARFRTGVARHEWVPFLGAWRLSDYLATYDSQVWAALLQSGVGAKVSAQTTMKLLGIEIVNPQVVVVLPQSRHMYRHTADQARNYVILRDSIQDEGGQLVGNIPSVSRSRAVIDSLRIAPYPQAEAILNEALRRRWITPEALVSACTLLKGHKGLPQLRTLTDYAQSGSQAASEKLLVKILKANKLGRWELNKRILGGNGRLVGIGDAVNEEFKIVIEVDGRAWHTDVERFQRDRTRQNELVNEGWTVLRFTWEDLNRRPAHVVSVIREAMGNLASSKKSSHPAPRWYIPPRW